MKKSTLIRILLLLWAFSLSVYAYATTTFVPYEKSYYGKISPVKKYVATIVPAIPDANSVNRMDEPNAIYGTLCRISIRTIGADTAFGFILRDENGIAIFSKSDCNTVQMPLTYSLYEDDTEGNPHPGICIAGRPYFDVNNIGNSEVQTIQITSDVNDPNGGTFELLLDDINTAPIAYDANAAEVEAALEAISTIDDVTVDGNNLPGDANVMTVTFLGTQYGSDVNLMTIDVNNLTVDTPGTIITGTITESVKGAYDLEIITIDLYYTDPKY